MTFEFSSDGYLATVELPDVLGVILGNEIEKMDEHCTSEMAMATPHKLLGPLKSRLNIRLPVCVFKAQMVLEYHAVWQETTDQQLTTHLPSLVSTTLYVPTVTANTSAADDHTMQLKKHSITP